MDDPFAPPESETADRSISFPSALGRGALLVIERPLAAAAFVLLNLPGQLMAESAWGVVLGVLLNASIDPFATVYWNARARGHREVPYALAVRRWLIAMLLGALVSFAMLLGMVLLFVPGVIIGARWAFVTACVVLEGRGLGAFGASNALVRGRSLPIVGVVALSLVTSLVLGFIGPSDVPWIHWGSLGMSAVLQTWIVASAMTIYVALRD